MAKRPSLSVVIPSWNSHSQLTQNLSAVVTAAKLVDAEVIVVDDASFDNSLSYLTTLQDTIRLHRHETNLGFSATVNHGVQLARGRHVVLLNTDVKPAKDCFRHVLAYFADPAVFAITFNSGEGWAGGKWGRGLVEHFPINPRPNPTTPQPSLWASGGQAAFSKAKWQELGGLDLLYRPFYWEDVDLGYRAWKRGWRILWVPDCRCRHYHKASVIAGHFSLSYINTVAARNQLLFVWKNIRDKDLLASHFKNLPRLWRAHPGAFVRALLLLPAALAARRRAGPAAQVFDRQVLTHWSQHEQA